MGKLVEASVTRSNDCCVANEAGRGWEVYRVQYYGDRKRRAAATKSPGRSEEAKLLENI